MYKYSISMYDWEKPLNVLMKKVYNYASLHSNVDDICTATALVDLCRDRDNHRYDVFTHSDIIDIIASKNRRKEPGHSGYFSPVLRKM